MRQSTKMSITYAKRSLLGIFTTTMSTIESCPSSMLRCFHHVTFYLWKAVDLWRLVHQKCQAGARIGSLRKQRPRFHQIRLYRKGFEDSLPALFVAKKAMTPNTRLPRATKGRSRRGSIHPSWRMELASPGSRGKTLFEVSFRVLTPTPLSRHTHCFVLRSMLTLDCAQANDDR